MRSLLTLAAAASAYAQSISTTLTLDGTTALQPYDGHGALSAGASSRLLWDYAEPMRSQILDYLFKPQFGASLHMLKVEIGGDAQSTDGTEPSHMHTRDDLSCTRGYELWLLQQAKARNPAIRTYGLSWGTPWWLGNGTYYSQDHITYNLNWLQCMQQQGAGVIDYIGYWNEAAQPSTDWAVQFRSALDASGFASTKVIAMDGQFDETLWQAAVTNATFAAAFDGVGLHYPCDKAHPEVQAFGKTFWASEDYSRDPAWSNGGTYWGKALSQNYVTMNATSTISWSLIWSAYTNLVCNGAGLMRAHTPWSGWYEVSAPIWASAMTTQFVQPGWRYLHVPGGGSGFLPGGGGTFVSLVPPSGTGLTLVIETLNNNDCIARNLSDYAITVKLVPGSGLPGPGTVLQQWMTTSEVQFQRVADVTVAADGTFTLQVPADAMVTVSTTTGAQKGSFATPIPEDAPFPIPYSDDFSSYSYDAMARYFSDQGGSWAVRNGTLMQVSGGNPGSNGWAANPDPLTQIGGETWTDYAVAATVTFSGPVQDDKNAAAARLTGGVSRADVERRQRVAAERASLMRTRMTALRGEEAASALTSSLTGTSYLTLAACDSTQPAQQWFFNAPATGYVSTGGSAPSLPQICLNLGGCDGTQVIGYDCVTQGGTCCGADCYQNLQWSLNGQGQLLNALPAQAGNALSLNSSGILTMAAIGSLPAAAQTWAYNASSGLLSIEGKCLSAPPVTTYTRVCGRVTTFSGFNALEAMAGYCLNLKDNGMWQLVVGGTSVLNGTVAGNNFQPSSPHRLQLEFAGTVITAWIDGTLVAQIRDSQFAYGNVMLGSGWHTAAFSNFTVTPPAYAVHKA